MILLSVTCCFSKTKAKHLHITENNISVVYKPCRDWGGWAQASHHLRSDSTLQWPIKFKSKTVHVIFIVYTVAPWQEYPIVSGLIYQHLSTSTARKEVYFRKGGGASTKKRVHSLFYCAVSFSLQNVADKGCPPGLWNSAICFSSGYKITRSRHMASNRTV